MFALAPAAGVLVERWNRHRVLIVAQTLSMLQSAALAALALGGIIKIWQVIALSVMIAQDRSPTVADLLKDPAVKLAIDSATSSEPQTIDDQVRFCEVPAPVSSLNKLNAPQ